MEEPNPLGKQKEQLASISKQELEHRLDTISANTLRLVLKQTSDVNDEFAKILYQVICLDAPPAPSASGVGSVPGEGGLVEVRDVSTSATENEVVDLTGADDDDDGDGNQDDVNTAVGTGKQREKRKAESDVEKTPKKQRSGTDMLSAVAALRSHELQFRKRYKHCSNCYELFDVLSEPCHDHEGDDETWDAVKDEDEYDSDQEPCECVYHPGTLEVDEDAFPDDDPEIHGTADEDWKRREFPENYTWDCCDEKGDGEGCTMGRHRADGASTMFADIAEERS